MMEKSYEIIVEKLNALKVKCQPLVRWYYSRRFERECEYKEYPCPICENNSAFTTLYAKDRYGLSVPTVRCENCGLVQVRPTPTEEFLKKFYSSRMYRGLYFGIVSPLHKKGNDGGYRRSKINREFIDKHITDLPKQALVLDFGCADCTTLLDIKADHPEWLVHGLEPGESFAFTNKEKLNGFYSWVDQIPKNTKFDLVLINHVLEHLHHPDDVLQELAEHLTDNGSMVIEVPDYDRYGSDIKPIHISHIYHFTKETLEKLAAKSGLRTTFATNEEVIDTPYGVRVILKKKKGS